jgi:hypothetical protein
VAVAAGLATILTLGYGVRVAAQGITHAWDSLGAVPGSAESGPLRHILEPEAQSIAGKAIKLTAPAKDGGPAVFQARQAGPNEVVLTAGSDSFEAGTIFNGHAALVDVTLTGRGLDAAELTPANAADVSHVFIETTTGIPRSGGSAIDRQVDLSNPEASQARDRNDLIYAVGGDHEGQAWSGIYGVNNDTNSNGYVGYSTDPSAILTGPGPNHGLPEFDSGYWGGGSPPPLFADGGNASQAQTASDAAEQAAKAFQAALAELRSN